MRTIKVIILSLLIAPALGLLAFGPRGGDDVPPGRVVGSGLTTKPAFVLGGLALFSLTSSGFGR